MLELVLLFVLIFNVLMVIVVVQDAIKSGRDWLLWGFTVFLFGIFGMALYLFYLSQIPTRSSVSRTSPSDVPSLRVQCDVVGTGGDEKTVGMVIRSNDIVAAKETFTESCASEGLVLTEEPSVSVDSSE